MDQLPLEGIRVVDLTWAGVGPYCTFLCGLMGAECIKVETGSRPSHFRGAPLIEQPSPEKTSPRVYSLDELYLNKLGITLNMKHAKGLALMKELISISDVVAENFQAGVMDRLGLSYDEVRKVNPGVVMISMSAHGATGPERDGKGLAQVFGALGGASYVTGYEDGPPVEIRLPADLVSGTAAGFALVSALLHAKTTGRGAYIDSASREVLTSFIGESILDAHVNERDPSRVGNRDSFMAPHNVYRCRGDDAWLSIAVGTVEEWNALCEALGRPEWLKDQRFADANLRWLNQTDLARQIGEWAMDRDPIEAMEFLQRRGVPATASYSAQDLLADPHLHEREAFFYTEDMTGDPFVMMGAPWKFSRTPAQVRRKPPTIGEHNVYVYSELLGVTPSELDNLVQAGVVA